MCASEKVKGWFDSRPKAAHGSGEAALAPGDAMGLLDSA